MKRILFVDDEPRVLDGMRRVLRARRHHWDAVFLTSPSAALLDCEREPFDIVVSDMRMPEMDGATFLTAVAERWPGTVRLVLTGQTGIEAAMRASGVAHQFLTKPCEPAALEAVLDRACALRDLVSDPTIERIVGGLSSLPAAPAAYRELSRVAAKEDVGIEELAAVVERDPSLAAKLLQLVNSSFFGPGRNVTSVETAVSLLGSRLIQSLAMVHGVFRSTERIQLPRNFDPKAEQAHAIAVAALARRFGRDRAQADALFSAGLLHDVGRLLLAIRAPKEFDQIAEHAREHGISRWAAERALIGTTHAELGAFALGVWGLPWPIISGARYHHAPADESDPTGLAIYVHVADALTCDDPIESPLDEYAVADRQLTHELTRWRELASEMETSRVDP